MAKRFAVYVEAGTPELTELVKLILGRTLRQENLDLKLSRDDDEGVALIRQLQPSLVLLGLPSNSNRDLERCFVLQHLKTNPESWHGPIIAIVDKRQSTNYGGGKEVPGIGQLLVAWGPQEIVSSVKQALKESEGG